jgi:aryl-alcohol dehydrogenase-like predicted oxidoreductase
VDGRAALQAHDPARRHDVPLIANQPHYSMLWRVAEAQVMPVCERIGVGQFASVPLAQGVLTGKYRDGRVPAGSRAAGPSATRPLLMPELLERVELLRGVADDAGLTRPSCRWRGRCSTRRSPRWSWAPVRRSRSPRTPRPPASGWTSTC